MTDHSPDETTPKRQSVRDPRDLNSRHVLALQALDVQRLDMRFDFDSGPELVLDRQFKLRRHRMPFLHGQSAVNLKID